MRTKTPTNRWLIPVNGLLGLATIMALWLGWRGVEWYGQVLGYGAVTLLAGGSCIAFWRCRESLARSLFIFNVLTSALISALTILHWCGLFDNFASLTRIIALIHGTGGWGYTVYVILQLTNIVFLPLPGFLFILAGLAIFGTWPTFFLTYVTFVGGAIICFVLGRTYGQKAAVWCIGPARTAQYQAAFGHKGNLLFLLMQILPFFPDDALCILAGLTKMKFPFFLVTILIAKLLYVAVACFLGTGSIIPFHGWGIPVWLAIFAGCALLFGLFCKYQNRFESWLARLTRHKKTLSSEKTTSASTTPVINDQPVTTSQASQVQWPSSSK